MAIFSRLAATALLLATAGCAQIDHGLGEAVKYDMALQTIDPDPVYAPGSAEPGMAGTVNAEAAKRYRTGTVKPVEVVNTAKAAASGSGSDPK